MEVTLRPGAPADAVACGTICYRAFAAIASAHSFPCDFGSVGTGIGVVSMKLGHPGFFSVVAEGDGRVVGSNFLDERNEIRGVGPITVDPAVQDASVGRRLMEVVLDRASERRAPGVRLVQAAYHSRSLALYAKLGFQVREPLVCLQGPAVAVAVDGYRVRAATAPDQESCDEVCRAVHGHDRAGEVADAIERGSALVVEHGGEVTGYSTGLGFFAHSVGRTDEDLKALIGTAPRFEGPGILVPARNHELLRFCLDGGLRVTQMMTLMATGFYREPAGAFLPSVTY